MQGLCRYYCHNGELSCRKSSREVIAIIGRAANNASPSGERCQVRHNLCVDYLVLCAHIMKTVKITRLKKRRLRYSPLFTLVSPIRRCIPQLSFRSLEFLLISAPLL